MTEKERKISSGTGAFLVCDFSLEDMYCFFYSWLRVAGFKSWGHEGHWGMPWVYVNLNSKIYAPGMPGIPITESICDHAITIEEFFTIYKIYEKYEGKERFVFYKERFDYDK